MLKTVSFEFNPLEDLWATRTGVSVYLRFRSDVMIDDGNKWRRSYRTRDCFGRGCKNERLSRGKIAYGNRFRQSRRTKIIVLVVLPPVGGGEGGPRPPPPTAAPDRLAYPTTLRHESLSRRACTVRTPRWRDPPSWRRVSPKGYGGHERHRINDNNEKKKINK